MSKRKPAARYMLPEYNDLGWDYACVPIPKDQNHHAAFWGQMHALASAYVWSNDDTHAALDAAAAWREIVDKIQISDRSCACPEFYAYANDVNCPNTVDLRTIRVMDDCGQCTSVERVYFSRSIIDVIAGVARIGYSFATLDGDLDCGGHICQIRAFQTGIGTPTWNLQWRDCDFEDHEVIDTTSGDEFVYNDISAIWVCLSLNSNFCASMAIDGPPLCILT